MTKQQILWIRACKSKDPYTRVKSLYRRFYWKGPQPEAAISGILVDVCAAIFPITGRRLVQELHPVNGWKFADCDYPTRVMRILISHVRYTSVDTLNGFIPPARYRRETT